MKTIFLKLSIILFLTLVHLLSIADPKHHAHGFDTLYLPNVFNDHMVLQREQPVNLWGRTRHNQNVEIRFRGFSFKSKADSSGRWRITIPAMEAGGPHEMTITSGTERKILKDIFIGDVWLAAGQSNMAFRFKYSNEEDKKSVLSDLEHSNVRMYEVAKIVEGGKLLNKSDDPWTPANKDNIESWSAVAFYFARALYMANDIPIGIINCSQGASRIEAWMSPEAIEVATTEVNVPWKIFKDIRMHYGNPSVLYQSMLNKVIPYSVKGVIWYQGESNANEAESYKILLPALIKNWRADWGQMDLPFLFAQLPAYEPSKDKDGDSWAIFREAQAETDKSVENTGMVVLIDVGAKDDIHPKSKKVVGERLARLARAKVYKENIAHSGPSVMKVKYRGEKAVISFRHTYDGLRCKGEYLQGFEIKGANGLWQKAHARIIMKNKIVVWNEKTKQIVAVRYGWANAPTVNLYNSEGLPTAPFKNQK